MSLSDTLFDALNSIETTESIFKPEKKFEDELERVKESIWQLARQMSAPPGYIPGPLPTWKEYKTGGKKV